MGKQEVSGGGAARQFESKVNDHRSSRWGSFWRHRGDRHVIQDLTSGRQVRWVSNAPAGRGTLPTT